MEFDDDRDDRQEVAIQKANEMWNDTFRGWTRDNIRYDDWLEIFDRAIKECKTPIVDLGCGSGNDTLSIHEETMGRYGMEKVLWRGAMKVKK